MSCQPLPESDAAKDRVVVATHGHCMDGMCSAAMFSRLLHHIHPDRSFAFSYYSAGYGPGQSRVESDVLNGKINAILDFRFSVSDELTWYFDHHVSAFPEANDRSIYDAKASGAPRGERRMFHDASYGSCTKLLADIGASHFGLDPAPVADLVHWADLIDRAAFDSAEMAVARKEPELQLMTVVENMADDAFLNLWVPRLLEEPFAQVARSPEIAAHYLPLKVAHEAYCVIVRERAREDRNVVFMDLSDQVLEVAGKFVAYALFPNCAYSVALSRSKTKCKISIGYNPWGAIPRRHDIASICERYGGGGHPVVGAIALPFDKLAEAQGLAIAIAEELRN